MNKAFVIYYIYVYSAVFIVSRPYLNALVAACRIARNFNNL